jgi:asparagine synthase (glutamine-hydrolysing)
MSGVFGYADPSCRLGGCGILGQMASAMSHRPWYETALVNDEGAGVGIGRIGIGIFNKNQRAVWNRQRTAALLLTGEIYNLSSLNLDASQPETSLLELYERDGEQFVGRLQGAFIFALWDKAKNQVIVANDRFGVYPLFYSLCSGRLVFAPELKAVLKDPGIPKDLDPVGMA